MRPGRCILKGLPVKGETECRASSWIMLHPRGAGVKELRHRELECRRSSKPQWDNGSWHRTNGSPSLNSGAGGLWSACPRFSSLTQRDFLMGEPMDRSRRVFLPLKPFHDVFPGVESAGVEYAESGDFETTTRRAAPYRQGDRERP